MAADTSKRAARLARQIETFARKNGGSAEGQISYVGQVGFRIVLVGSDGGWGDLMAPSKEVADEAVERAGIPLRENFDGEMADRVLTGPYEWDRMAGVQLGGPANAAQAAQAA
ncbi:hypothetical protein [Streptomyces iconiensis]|uniref:Uncharacterized protein n=1 Tax=Streptomyces iconiensis TaxID=1384038 RepID=A0ABT6ZVN0_9ACTN|nr:hypothetical protein [Streptomyces iconiensis]MDJ1133130.1 hypothetical protein [Streptomyces iconiensis]